MRSAVSDGAEGITAEEGSREGTVKLGNASPLSYGGPRGAAEAHGIRRGKGCAGPSGEQEARAPGTPDATRGMPAPSRPATRPRAHSLRGPPRCWFSLGFLVKYLL